MADGAINREAGPLPLQPSRSVMVALAQEKKKTIYLFLRKKITEARSLEADDYIFLEIVGTVYAYGFAYLYASLKKKSLCSFFFFIPFFQLSFMQR